MSNPCLIVDVTDIDTWPTRLGGNQIPDVRRPTQLQPSREIAEAEALRLNKLHPHHRFVVFEAQTMTKAIDVPTHVSMTGQVLLSGNIPRLVCINDPDDLIPF